MASQTLFSAETVFHRLQKIPISVTATQGRRPAVRAMNIKLSLPDLSWRKPIPRLTAPHHSWVINLQYISKGLSLSLSHSLTSLVYVAWKKAQFSTKPVFGPRGLIFCFIPACGNWRATPIWYRWITRYVMQIEFYPGVTLCEYHVEGWKTIELSQTILGTCW